MWGLADMERGMRRERGTRGEDGRRRGAGVGELGAWERGAGERGKEAGKKVAGEKLRKVPRGCSGEGEKKERILRLWRGKKANKSIVYKLVVFLYTIVYYSSCPSLEMSPAREHFSGFCPALLTLIYGEVFGA